MATIFLKTLLVTPKYHLLQHHIEKCCFRTLDEDQETNQRGTNPWCSMSFLHVSKWRCPSDPLCMSRTQWSRGNCVSGAGKWESEQTNHKEAPASEICFFQTREG